MKTKKKSVGKRIRTLRQIVAAADKAGAQVSVALVPRQKLDLSLLRRNAIYLKAIYLLAETRSMAGFECAQALLREADSIHNETQLMLMKLREEVINRNPLEPNNYPVP